MKTSKTYLQPQELRWNLLRPHRFSQAAVSMVCIATVAMSQSGKAFVEISQRYAVASQQNPGNLGQGVDPSDMESTKGVVAVLDVNSPGMASDPLTVKHVNVFQSRYDFLHYLNASGGIQTRNIVPSLKTVAGFEWTDTTTISRNDLNLAYEFTRDFGARTFNQLRLDPAFEAFVKENRDLPDAQFLSKLQARYGYYVVTGWREVAHLSIVFQYHFDSSYHSQHRKAFFDAKFGNLNVYGAEATGAIEDLTVTKTSTESLSYTISTSEVNLPVPRIDQIRDFSQLTNMLDKIESFVNGITSRRVPNFILEPITSLRLNIGREVPRAFPFGDYGRFNENYRDMRAKLDELTALSSNGAAYWLTQEAKLELEGVKKALADHLSFLEKMVRDHFQSGKDLVVPAESEMLKQRFAAIPRPEIRILLRSVGRGGENNASGLYVGSVKLSHRSKLVANPFPATTRLKFSRRFLDDPNQTPMERDIPVHNDPDEFYTAWLEELKTMWLSISWGAEQDKFRDNLKTSPEWNEIRKAANGDCAVAFFGFGLSWVKIGRNGITTPAGEDAFVSMIDGNGRIAALSGISTVTPLSCDGLTYRTDAPLKIEVGLNLEGIPGSVFRIEKAKKLAPADWTPLGTIQLERPSQWFRYPPSFDSDMYFYRAVKTQ